MSRWRGPSREAPVGRLAAPASALEPADRQQVPVGGQAPEQRLQPDRALDVPERVAAERHERVVGADVGRARAPWRTRRGDRPCRPAAGRRRGSRPRRASGRASSRGRPCRSRCAGSGRSCRRRRAPRAARCDRSATARWRAASAPGAPTTSRWSSPATATSAVRRRASRAQLALERVEVDPQAERLHERDRRPTISNRPVAGSTRPRSPVRSSCERRAEREVGGARSRSPASRCRRSTRARPSRRARQSVRRPAARRRGSGTPIAPGARVPRRRRQVGHPGGGLGLAVHDVEAPPPTARRGRPSAPRRRGASRPPATVRNRSDGARSRSAPARSASSNVCGTPAMFVTPCGRAPRWKHGSTTEACVSTTPAPARRCECNTDRP